MCKAWNCDIGGIIYGQTFYNSSHHRLEMIQYNAALHVAGTIRGMSKEKSYQEVNLETFQQTRLFRKFCCMFILLRNQSSWYLFKKSPPKNRSHRLRNSSNLPIFKVKFNILYATRKKISLIAIIQKQSIYWLECGWF